MLVNNCSVMKLRLFRVDDALFRKILYNTQQTYSSHVRTSENYSLVLSRNHTECLISKTSVLNDWDVNETI